MARKKIVFSMSSWFCLPEQNMKDFEILNRASAFLLKSKCPSFSTKHKYHVVTASHVVAPWRWPKYYPDEWIQFVNESHTHYTIELRHDDGVFFTQAELLPRSYHHPTRDLAVLHFETENEFETLESLGASHGDILPPMGPLKADDNLEFQGHELMLPVDAMSNPNPEGDDLRVPIPRNISGVFNFRTQHQHFARTERILTDGMCGGPVLVKKLPVTIHGTGASNNFSQAREREYVCGMVDGIVPADHSDAGVRGLASFIESAEIDRFVDDVEAGMAETVLIGGQAARHVGADQDPGKMDINKILSKFT